MLKFHRLLLTAGTFLDRPAFVLKAMTPDACKRIAGGEPTDNVIDGPGYERKTAKRTAHAAMYGAGGV